MKHEHYVTNDMHCNLIGRTLQGAVHNFHVRFLPDPFLVAKGAGPQTKLYQCCRTRSSCTSAVGRDLAVPAAVGRDLAVPVL